MQLTKKKINTKRGIIYVLVFLFTLHVTPGTYINSSFLEQFVGEGGVGIVYAIASLVTIGGFFSIRPLLSRFGNYKTFLSALTLELISLTLMSIPTLSPSILLSAYILGFTMRSIAFFHLDIFLEDASSDDKTGSIRGFYLTMMNLSFLIGPFIAGFLITDAMYWKVYLISGIILLPSLFITFKYLRHFKDPVYVPFAFIPTCKTILSNRDIRSVFEMGSLLRFFYSWMIIYTPIYLVQHIGFSISETTFIIGIALVPFILFQSFFGYLADKFLGEKELLVFGFLVLAFFTSAMAFFPYTSFWAWVGILFLTRIGASAVEVMSETYFFKKIRSSDVNIISMYRMTRPFVYLFSPLIGSLLLLIVDIRFLFLFLGIIMLYGVRYSLMIKDTL
jgi:MFS family permease